MLGILTGLSTGVREPVASAASRVDNAVVFLLTRIEARRDRPVPGEDTMAGPVASPLDGAVEAPGSAPAPAAGAAKLVPFVVALFFAWGFSTVLLDTVIPKLKALFALSYAQAMLTQFAFFIAYLVFSVPAGLLLSRIGYVRGIVAGLGVMIAGCLLFSPAAASGLYWGFLLALFVMAAGVTILQVAANPLIAILGPPHTSHSRLNLAQAFNSLGTFIGPLVGAAVILKRGLAVPDVRGLSPAALAAFRRSEAHAVQLPFLGIAVILAVLAVVFWRLRGSAGLPSAARSEASLSSLRLLRTRPRLSLGALSIFLYVGGEVSIGSLLVNYLMQPKALGTDAATAGRLVAVYWGGAMVGRLVGSGVMLRLKAGRALTACALGAATLVAFSAATSGWWSAVAILAVGLCNSIMFPTIFTLAIEELGGDTPQGAGLLCMAIVGGAVVPVLTGAAADRAGLSLALLVPIACFVWIATYGWLAASGRLPARAAGRP
jgi:FHS family L-fucose permease-like MFS transporter